MIDRKETISILKSFIIGESDKNPIGFYIQGQGLPLYKNNKNILVPICLSAKKDTKISHYCNKFYSELEQGNFKTICPYGISLEYYKKDCILGSVGVFTQLNYQKDINSSQEIQKNLSRQSKKEVSKSLIESEKYVFSDSNSHSLTLDKFRRFLDTILSGRVSDSIRTLAHEILTPVQGALNDAYKINDMVKSSEEKDTSDLLIRNISSIESLSKRIQYLLTEDLTHDKGQLRKITVHDLIENICNKYVNVAEYKNVIFKTAYNKYNRLVEAVPDQINIVFNVLIENSVKYSFTGFDNKKNEIRISYGESGTNLEISISNLGCLITEEEIKERRIFQLGARGFHSNDKGRQGTGSGLFIAEKIVNAHNGEIRVTSEPIESQSDDPCGATTFTVSWPIYAT